MAARARFVARYGAYSVGVQSFNDERLGHDGKMIPSKRRIDAQFHNHIVSEDDFALALQSFAFPGLPFDQETNQNVSPRYRVAVWDSEWAQQNEGLSDGEIELIVSKLRSDPSYGADHVEVDVASAMPFPNYDALSPDEVLQLLKLTGIDVAGVIAYERENANRQVLLDKLEGVEASDDSVVVSA